MIVLACRRLLRHTAPLVCIPGRAESNWSWRRTEDLLSDRCFESLHDLTKNSERWGGPG